MLLGYVLEPYKMFMLLCAYTGCIYVTCVLNFCALLNVTALLYCIDFRPAVSAVRSLPVP